MSRHIGSNREMADEDIERLPFIIESLREPAVRAMRNGKDYQALHDRLRHVYGKAVDHRCQDCLGPAAEWSLESYEDTIYDRFAKCQYSPDLTRYRPRCRRCHKQHDMAIRRAELATLNNVQGL